MNEQGSVGKMAYYISSSSPDPNRIVSKTRHSACNCFSSESQIPGVAMKAFTPGLHRALVHDEFKENSRVKWEGCFVVYGRFFNNGSSSTRQWS